MASPTTYRNLWQQGELAKRAEQAAAKLGCCDLCAHECRINRLTAGADSRPAGICRTGAEIRISGHGPHFGEEDVLVGPGGSGVIFFSGCNLRCVFCQNWEISHDREGHEVTPAKLARIMLELQQRGCHNINLVTPTPYLPGILAALDIACDYGLTLPLVYNCGGYESLSALKLLDGVVDIYMPDAKFGGGDGGEDDARGSNRDEDGDGAGSRDGCNGTGSRNSSNGHGSGGNSNGNSGRNTAGSGAADEETVRRLTGARNYVGVVKAALKEMHRQVGDLVVDPDGLAVSGLLIRHLVLPGGLAGTAEMMRFIARELSPDTYVNIMDQYSPYYRAREFPPLDRRITTGEFQGALAAAVGAGLYRLEGLAQA